MVLALFNVEFQSWSTAVFATAAIVIVLFFLFSSGLYTFLVFVAIVVLIAVILYYLGVRVDRRMRHGGGR